MEFINIHTSAIDSMDFIRCAPPQRAAWLLLLRFCAGQENGGKIVGAREWGDTTWQQLCRVKLREVKNDCGLFFWDGADLIVNFYPSEQEKKVISNRKVGGLGGRPKKLKANHMDNHVDNHVVRECENVMKGNEREGNEKKEIPPTPLDPDNAAEAEGMDDMLASMKTPIPEIVKRDFTGVPDWREKKFDDVYQKSSRMHFKIFENNHIAWIQIFSDYDLPTLEDAKGITRSDQRWPGVIDDICKLIKTGEEKRKIQPRWTTLEAAEEWERHINPEFKCFAKPDDMKKHWPRLRIESIKNYLKNCGYDLERAK
jgi:hypothetical protein